MRVGRVVSDSLACQAEADRHADPDAGGRATGSTTDRPPHGALGTQYRDRRRGGVGGAWPLRLLASLPARGDRPSRHQPPHRLSRRTLGGCLECEPPRRSRHAGGTAALPQCRVCGPVAVLGPSWPSYSASTTLTRESWSGSRPVVLRHRHPQVGDARAGDRIATSTRSFDASAPRIVRCLILWTSCHTELLLAHAEQTRKAASRAGLTPAGRRPHLGARVTIKVGVFPHGHGSPLPRGR